MKRYNRIFTIVIDSLGVGPMDDSHEYNDINVNIFNNIWESQNGLPDELIREFETKFGRKKVGNKYARGTEILEEYGEHEMKTGDIIVYTSVDSVLQICGH